MTSAHKALAVAALLLGGAAALMRNTADAAHFISALDLGERVARQDPTLRVFDLRPEAEFEESHVAGAQQTSVTLLTQDAERNDVDAVVYAESDDEAAQAGKQLRSQGFSRVFVLRGGIDAWRTQVFEPELADNATDAEKKEFEEAARLSRYFGGRSKRGVPRSELSTQPLANKKGGSAQSSKPVDHDAKRSLQVGCR
jgi:rhodanese-related sulfurtransferase